MSVEKKHDFYTIHYILCFLLPILDTSSLSFLFLVTRASLFPFQFFFMFFFFFGVAHRLSITRTLERLFARCACSHKLIDLQFLNKCIYKATKKKVHQINVEHIVKCSRMQKTWRAHSTDTENILIVSLRHSKSDFVYYFGACLRFPNRFAHIHRPANTYSHA